MWLEWDEYVQLDHPFLGPLIKGSGLFSELFCLYLLTVLSYKLLQCPVCDLWEEKEIQGIHHCVVPQALRSMGYVPFLSTSQSLTIVFVVLCHFSHPGLLDIYCVYCVYLCISHNNDFEILPYLGKMSLSMPISISIYIYISTSISIFIYLSVSIICFKLFSFIWFARGLSLTLVISKHQLFVSF